MVRTAISARSNAAIQGLFGVTPAGEIKQRSVRGGVVATVAQVLMFVLQTGSTIALARLLSPEDFGLQGMVVAMTGLFGLFRDMGLSIPTVQSEVLTHKQTSNLFWINVAVGATLTIVAAAMAPFLVTFYKEPRLLSMTIVSAASFLLNSLGIQHGALLNRAMRFVTIAKVNVLALAISVTIGVVMAAVGWGYWALVAMAVTNSAVNAVALWVAMPWLPGRPTRGSGVGSMLRMGGTVTLNSIVVYVAYNAEKVLLGRFWGTEALGLYGRAYQLINLPVNQLNNAISTVAFPAMSRIQSDTSRLCRAFLKGYSVLISLTIPVVICSALFADEIVKIVLGPKWTGAAAVLRLLSPSVLALALVNPFGWFLQATGRVTRSLNIAFLIAPVMILGVVAGLRHGPTGVAQGYSVAIVLLVIPLIAWSKHDTGITTSDYCDSIKRPLIAGAMAGAAGWLFKSVGGLGLTPIPLLILGMTLSLGVYAWILLIVMNQKSLYADLLDQMYQRRALVKD